MTHYLTRAMLDRNAPEHALLPLLDPADADAALDAHHRLMWTLFPGRDATRDFLWRADEKGKFLILSAREPQRSSLFKPLESKPFAPVLAAGDRLAFVLRANATRDRRSGPRDEIVPGTKRRPRRHRRVDVVMHAMQEQSIVGRTTGPQSRAVRRMEVAGEAALVWLAGQGERRGFSVDADALTVDDYRVRSLRHRDGKEAIFGVLDLKGLLTVRAPEVFTSALLEGFGRAKAYGFGLMLVRRA